MIYVLYHSNCYDGFGAAFSAWKYLGDSAKYIPVAYGYPPPEMPDASEVFIVDFSYPVPELTALADKSKIVVLDHHKTAEANLKDFKHPNATVIFDMERSGAMITWDYFHHESFNRDPFDLRPHPAPLLVQHIQDRDLWRFQMPGSREVHASLVSHPMEFALWDKFDIPTLIVEGAALLRQYQQLVDNICKKPYLVRIGDYTVPAVNTSIAWSEVGEKLGDLYPDAPFVASFTEFEDITMWSLRTSKNNRTVDVSAVAKQFGGGGHAAAAGFKVSRTKPIEVLN